MTALRLVPPACEFCAVVRAGGPFVLRNPAAVVLRPTTKLARRHYLVLPRDHVAYLHELRDDLYRSGHLLQLLALAARTLDAPTYRVHAGGPGVARVAHLHFHLLGG